MDIKISIAAPIETVWELLNDKIFHPEKYMDNVEEVEITERDENEFIRKLFTADDEVTELVIINKENLSIQSNLVKHTFMKGNLIQHLSNDENGNTILSIENYRSFLLEELKDFDLRPAIEAALEEIKLIAENK